MFKNILCCTLFLCFNLVKAQNLVLNPSLDVFITCPGFGQFNNTFISNWNKPSIASSDYYNYNCPGIQPSVQTPYSGEGYAGIIAYNFGTEYREYITGTLTSPLVAGKTYTVEFYASLNNGYIQAVEELGAYLSVAAPGPFSNVLHISVTPQIENQSGALDDTSSWMKIGGQFVATGGEQFITIGNFHDDATTTISQPGSVGSFGAYYFIDAVSVILDSTTSTNEIQLNPDFNLTITPTQLHIELTNLTAKDFPLHLSGYNVQGQEIIQHTLVSSSETFPINFNANHIYFFVVRNNYGFKLSKSVFLYE